MHEYIFQDCEHHYIGNDPKEIEYIIVGKKHIRLKTIFQGMFNDVVINNCWREFL